MAKKGKQQHIVGREGEMQLLHDIMDGSLPYSIINIYGVGGIGKTVVCRKFETYCTQKKVPYATIVGDDPINSTTIDNILYAFRDGLEKNVARVISNKAFDEFDQRLGEYQLIREGMEKGGGIDRLYNIRGELLDHKLLERLETITEQKKNICGVS